uniref:Myb/SANT-like domain-containing protein n=1 Tax=Zea mays TaxID=4577 RepID=A0A804R6R8_MAIZE
MGRGLAGEGERSIEKDLRQDRRGVLVEGWRPPSVRKTADVAPLSVHAVERCAHLADDTTRRPVTRATLTTLLKASFGNSGDRKISTRGVEDTSSPSSRASAATASSHRTPPTTRGGRHTVALLACERRHHIFPSNFADPASSHTSGVSPRFAAGHIDIDIVILDPDECVCRLHGSSTDLARMFGRGSPRMNLIQAATMKKISPRSTTNKRKKRTSPKVGRLRANWNSGLEKDKEKELKRDYKALKEARQQSGVSWDERLCRIEAEEPIWNNLTTSNERLKKFRTKSFPLFEALGELYDGNIAKGTMNFTSIEPSRPPVTQPCQDDELRVLDPPAPTSVSKRAKNVGTGNSRTRINKRTQDRNVVEMMGRFLEMKEKQAEADERATTNANEDDFPIQTCIAIVDGMEELSDDEKVDAYDVRLQEHDMIYEAKVMKDDFVVSSSIRKESCNLCYCLI